MRVKVQVENMGENWYQVIDNPEVLGEEEKRLYEGVTSAVSLLLEKSRVFGGISRMHVEILPDDLSR
jgi:hypothetical protein